MYFNPSILLAITAGILITLPACTPETAQSPTHKKSRRCEASAYLTFNTSWLETATWKDVFCKIYANLAKSYIPAYACMDFQIGSDTVFSAHWPLPTLGLHESGDSYVDLYLENREIIVLTHTQLQGSETELQPLARERFLLDSEENMKSLHAMYLSDNPWICIIPDLQGNAYQTLQNLKDLQMHIPYSKRLMLHPIPLAFFYNYEKEERARSPKEFKRMAQSEAITARIFKNETMESILRQYHEEKDAIDNAPLTIQTVLFSE
ncbi:hypothetical protein [Akkermansia glycaniphila]|uniref:Prokaryotic membrane lipoprotein lipid attachment site profile n=1 Tax=Akkermansia glycaniphila TaxID=1679444 RepID=A0A1H6LE18_9BACT|nr:hypothetical protein [Akkermansia glycaniphila]SEH83487.1 Hypothetical protein PYTT_1095 [Akkermansia glycaniphila]